jgi:hypothetical protein
MIHKSRVDAHFADRKLHRLELSDLDRSRQILPTHGEKRNLHLGGKNRSEAGARALVSQDANRVLGFVRRKEERKPLNMIPVGVS